jgi:hypothetical protein
LNAYPEGGFPVGITPSPPPGWDEWVGITDEGYDRFILNENGKTVAVRKRQNLYTTDFLGSKAASFISDKMQTVSPFSSTWRLLRPMDRRSQPHVMRGASREPLRHARHHSMKPT